MDSTVDKITFFLLITRSGQFDYIKYIIPSFSSKDGSRIIKKPELIPFLPSKFSQKGKRGAPFPLHYIYWTSRHQSWLNAKKKPKKLFFSKLVVYGIQDRIYLYHAEQAGKTEVHVVYTQAKRFLGNPRFRHASQSIINLPPHQLGCYFIMFWHIILK